jgi:hypothetical protein
MMEDGLIFSCRSLNHTGSGLQAGCITQRAVEFNSPFVLILFIAESYLTTLLQSFYLYLRVNMLSSIGIFTSTLVTVVTNSIPEAETVVFIGINTPFVSL